MDEQIINSLDQEILLLGTRTLSVLFKLGENALYLYLFYCLTAKRQSVANQKNILTIFATEQYCRQGLDWGHAKYINAKKILADNGLIQKIIKKDANGKIIGHYIKLNYVQFQNGNNGTQVQKPVVDKLHAWNNSMDGKSRPQILDSIIYNSNNKNINKNTDVLEKHSFSSLGSSSPPPSSEIPPSSKNSIIALTDLERWELATAMDVPLWVVQQTERNFWRYIEDPKNRKKYKTSYRTIRNWIDMGLQKGDIQNCNEVEKMELESQHPDKIKEAQEAFAWWAEQEKLKDGPH